MLKYTASEQIKIAIGVTSLILLTVVLMPLALFFIPAAFGITTLGYLSVYAYFSCIVLHVAILEFIRC